MVAALRRLSLLALIAVLCLPVQAQTAVWIDMDPACGHGASDDVDDCWALLLSLRSDLVIRGISTVFGNLDGDTTYRTAASLLSQFDAEDIPLFQGASMPMASTGLTWTPASEALSRGLEKERLVLIALGPVTNIATVLSRRPELTGQIAAIIAVAGKQQHHGPRFHPGASRIFHLHDLNFRADVDAFEVLLHSTVDIALIPYEVAARVRIRGTDLDTLSQGRQSTWLADISRPWLSFWQTHLESDGFFPFDSLAVSYVLRPERFECEDIPARIVRRAARFLKSRDDLIVSHTINSRTVRYCSGVDDRVKQEMLADLAN